MKRVLMPGALFLAVFCLMAVNTHAYLDPGSVNVLVQVIAGVAIMGGAAIAIFWKKIKLAFKKKKQAPPADTASMDAAADTSMSNTDQGTIRIERRSDAGEATKDQDNAEPKP